MYTRYLAVVLFAAAVAFACSPRSKTPEANAAEQRSAEEAARRASNRQADEHGTVGSLVVSSLDVTVRKEVIFALHVTNTGDKHIELTFPSGKTHDIVVLDSAGTEVWRWSGDRMFTQAVQAKLVSPRETVTYTERWVPVRRAGRYTAVVTLASTNHPVEQRTEFTLP